LIDSGTDGARERAANDSGDVGEEEFQLAAEDRSRKGQVAARCRSRKKEVEGATTSDNRRQDEVASREEDSTSSTQSFHRA